MADYFPKVGSEVRTRSGEFPSTPYVKQADGTWKPKYIEGKPNVLENKSTFGIDIWLKASPEERERMEEEVRKRLIRDLAGVDDETAERLGF